MQLLSNILTLASLYLLISLSLTIIYSSSKFFNITYAAKIALAAYLTFFINNYFEVTSFFAIITAIILVMILSFFLEFSIFEFFRKKNSQSIIMLMVSIGVYVVLQNIMSLIWGDAPITLGMTSVDVGHGIYGLYITDIQIVTIVASVTLFGGYYTLLRYTKLGRHIRAVSSNEELANIFGVNSKKIILWTCFMGSFLAAGSGILITLESGMTPSKGFYLLFNGLIVTIVSGLGSTWALVYGSILLATAQQLGAYFIDSKWMDAIAYIILIIFLIFRPLGFSGNQLKKTEI